MSRIRQIKPSWFLDKELRRGTTADAREFYIGLWMLADDEGYLSWDVERIAAELYPYDPFSRRERNVIRWAESLMTLAPAAPHLRIYTCGHAFLPHMKQHQRIAGTRSEGVSKAHRNDCRDVRSLPSLQVATSSHGNREGNSRERNVEEGKDAGARAPEGAAPAGSEFDRAMTAAGYPRPKVIA